MLSRAKICRTQQENAVLKTGTDISVNVMQTLSGAPAKNALTLAIQTRATCRILPVSAKDRQIMSPLSANVRKAISGTVSKEDALFRVKQQNAINRIQRENAQVKVWMNITANVKDIIFGILTHTHA